MIQDKKLSIYSMIMQKLDPKLFMKQKREKRIKILTPRQIFQRLPIVLAQVKVGNNSKILLNEIRQISYSLYQSK